MSEGRYLRHPDMRLTDFEGEDVVLHTFVRADTSASTTPGW